MEKQGLTGSSSSITPKAIIFRKFGNQAQYKVEQVDETIQSECPGLAISQKVSLFRCHLQLPEFSIMSDLCKKKKDAEQSAAGKAVEKLGICVEENIAPQDPFDAMVSRISYFFSEEFLKTAHPTSGHIRNSLQRRGDLSGWVPISALVGTDSKINSLCKSINPNVESNPLLAYSLIMEASSKSVESIVMSEEHLSLRRQTPYSSEIMKFLSEEIGHMPEFFCFKAVLIPMEIGRPIQELSIKVFSDGYYLDSIAHELGLNDASRLLLSRTFGKSSSEMRLYFVPQISSLSDQNAVKELSFEKTFNARASYISCQDICGDAIFAHVGYTWRSLELIHEDLPLHTYYRMLINKTPEGSYKLSRKAVLAASLPNSSTRSNWRGSFPKNLLCTFCHHHRLPEPVLSLINSSNESCKRLKCLNGKEYVSDSAKTSSVCSYKCEVKLFSKNKELILSCSPTDSYRKEIDAIHTASLMVLSWLNVFFKQPEEYLAKSALSVSSCVQANFDVLCKEFALVSSVHHFKQMTIMNDRPLDLTSVNCNLNTQNQKVQISKMSPNSGMSPSLGSFVSVSYTVFLVVKGTDTKEILEINDDFEFEIGIGAVISHLEDAVTQLCLGQSAFFSTHLPGMELILAAVDDSTKILPHLSKPNECCLEYSVTLLKLFAPLEDRLERALFNPPLSKQRVEFALQHIKESNASTLIDFGCGSGSLLVSLLDYSMDLEKIVGVDVSQKSLIRGAKLLFSKLNSGMDRHCAKLKSVVLYEGSILNPDSRLCEFDIGTCLEVIEHMEEDEARRFGDIVLGSFCPRLLVASTPNYEYNKVLKRGGGLEAMEEDSGGGSGQCFRNHDHKFEWTREEFNGWATDVGARHGYAVEFGGVGGSREVEPGFASQIAVFRREKKPGLGYRSVDAVDSCIYDLVWEWQGSGLDKS